MIWTLVWDIFAKASIPSCYYSSLCLNAHLLFRYFQKTWSSSHNFFVVKDFFKNVTLQILNLSGKLNFPGMVYFNFESVFTEINNTNQRTSGPVNSHLTPGPGIYFNAFIHVYSPRAGADNPLRTNVDVNRKPRSLWPFVASFKLISLNSDFIHIF